MKDHLEGEKRFQCVSATLLSWRWIPSPLYKIECPSGYNALTSRFIYELSDVALHLLGQCTLQCTHGGSLEIINIIIYLHVVSLGCFPARVPPATTIP